MLNLKMKANQSRRGFTLIEILVVVVILAILAAVVVPNVISRIKDAKVSAAISDISTFESSIDQYKLDMGTDPETLDQLLTPPSPRGKWNGPYLKNLNHIPMDPWGNPYVYKTPGADGRDNDIYSDGPDGQPGTSDDIQSWNMKGS